MGQRMECCQDPETISTPRKSIPLFLGKREQRV